MAEDLAEIDEGRDLNLAGDAFEAQREEPDPFLEVDDPGVVVGEAVGAVAPQGAPAPERRLFPEGRGSHDELRLDPAHEHELRVVPVRPELLELEPVRLERVGDASFDVMRDLRVDQRDLPVRRREQAVARVVEEAGACRIDFAALDPELRGKEIQHLGEVRQEAFADPEMAKSEGALERQPVRDVGSEADLGQIAVRGIGAFLLLLTGRPRAEEAFGADPLLIEVEAEVVVPPETAVVEEELILVLDFLGPVGIGLQNRIGGEGPAEIAEPVELDLAAVLDRGREDLVDVPVLVGEQQRAQEAEGPSFVLAAGDRRDRVEAGLVGLRLQLLPALLSGGARLVRLDGLALPGGVLGGPSRTGRLLLGQGPGEPDLLLRLRDRRPGAPDAQEKQSHPLDPTVVHAE